MGIKEKLEKNLPGMRENLQTLEMRHAWLLGEAKKMEAVIENQRGMIMQAESLLADDQETMPVSPPMPPGPPAPAFPPPVNGHVPHQETA